MLPGRGNLRGRDRGRGLRGVTVRDNDERSRRGPRSVRFATQDTPATPRTRRGNYQIPAGQARHTPRTTSPSLKKPTEQPGQTNASISASQGTFQQRYQLLKSHRDKERVAAIADGFLADPDRPRTLAEAITPVGTCQDMCAEFERVERVVQNDVWGPEVDPNSPSNAQGTTKQLPDEGRMVKKFRRAAAGIDEQLPSDLRPPLVLQKTLDYLFNDIVGQARSLANVHHFVWDRTRAIRNDFSIQQISKPAEIAIAIESYERIARFHILSLHQLAGPNQPYDKYDAQQEREQLDKTLLSLMQYYDDSRGRVQSANEAEFRAYCIIFQIQDPVPDLEDRVQSWPTKIVRNGRVQCALQVYAAANNTADAQGPLKPRTSHAIAQENWRRFWRLVNSNCTSYLMACVAEIYFNLVRRTALNAIWKAYRQGGQMKTEDWNLSELARTLGFDNEDDVHEFCGQYGFSIEEKADQTPYLDLTSVTGRKLSQPSLVQRAKRSEVVERKRCNRTFPAVINGLSVRAAEEAGLIEETLDEDAMEHDRPKNDSLFISGDSDEENRPANKPKTVTAGVQANAAKSSLLKPFGTRASCGVISAGADSNIPPNLTAAISDFDQKISTSSTTALDPWQSGKPPTSPFHQDQESSKPFSFLSQPPADFGNTGPAAFDKAASFTSSRDTSTTVFGFSQPPTSTLSKAEPSTSTPSPFDSNLTASSKPPATGFNFGSPAPFGKRDLHQISQTRPISFGSNPPTSSLDQSRQPASEDPVFRPLANAAQSSVFVGTSHSQEPPKSIGDIFKASSLPSLSASIPNVPTFPFSLPASSNDTSLTKNFRKPEPRTSTSPFQSSSETTSITNNHLSPRRQNLQSPLAFTSVTDVTSKQLDLSAQEATLPLNRPITHLAPAILLPITIQARPLQSSSANPLFDSQKTRIFALNTSVVPPTPASPPHLSGGSTTSKEHIAHSTEADKAQRSKLLDHLARNMVLEQFGFLDQFVEFTAGPMIITAQEQVKQERLRQQADDFRAGKVTNKYAQRWRDICWNRRLSRQGTERRRRLAREMQAKERQSRENSISSALQAFRDSVSSRSSRSSTRGSTQQDESSMRPQSTTKGDRRKHKANTMTFNANLPPGEDNATRLLQRPHRQAKAVTENPSRGSKEADATSVNTPNSQRSSSRLWHSFLPDGFLSSHSPLAASSPRVDTTRSTYFRLKAMGFDPRGKPLTLIPTCFTSDRKRPRDRDSEASATPGKKLHASGSSHLVRQQQPDTSYIPFTQTTRAPVANDEDEELFTAVRAARNAMSDSISFFQDEIKQDELRRSQISTGARTIASNTTSASTSNAVVNGGVSSTMSLQKEPPPAYRNRISKFLPREMYADVMMRRRRDAGASTGGKNAVQSPSTRRGWPRPPVVDGRGGTECVHEHGTRKAHLRDGRLEVVMQRHRGIETEVQRGNSEIRQLAAYASQRQEDDVETDLVEETEIQAHDDAEDEDDDGDEEGQDFGEAAQRPDYFISNATDDEEEEENEEMDSPYGNGETYMTNEAASDEDAFEEEDVEDDRREESDVDLDGDGYGYGADDMDEEGGEHEEQDEDEEGDGDEEGDEDEGKKRSPTKWTGKGGTSVEDAIEL